MAKMRKPMQPVEKTMVPSDETLKRLAMLPEDVKKMALAYAQGVASGQRISKSA